MNGNRIPIIFVKDMKVWLRVSILLLLLIVVTSGCTSREWETLSGDEVKALFSGKTVSGYHEKDHYSFIRYYESEGIFRSYQDGSTTPRLGRWWVNESGDICIQWEDEGENLCRKIMTAEGHYWKVLIRRDGGEEIIITYDNFVDGNVINEQAISNAASIQPTYRPPESAVRIDQRTLLSVILSATAFFAVLAFRWAVSRFSNRQPPLQINTLNPYEIASLAGGQNRVIDIAVINLIIQNILRLGVGKKPTLEVTDNINLPETAHTLERVIYKELKIAPLSIRDLRNRVLAEAIRISDRLREYGLLVSHRQQRIARLTSFFIVAPIAVINLFLGWVGILLALGLIVFTVAWQPLHRTSAGDRVLKTLRKQNSRRKKTDQYTYIQSEFLVLGAALFGLSALKNSPFDYVNTVLYPPGGQSSAGSGGCGG